MTRRFASLPLLVASFMILWPDPVVAQRTIVPLDGTWSVAEGVEPDAVPSRFDHTVAVPGLTSEARPAFPDVDQYETHEYMWNDERARRAAGDGKCEGLGRTRQKREVFWYARTFTAPAKTHAMLVVNKAQFGTAVWLNGKKVGEHLGCFTAGRFDVTTP